jgi:hypothetical protein
MAASIAEQPTLSVARRDSLFAGAFAAAATQVDYDVFPDGRFLMLRSLAPTTPRRDRLFVVVNWQQLIESNKSTR